MAEALLKATAPASTLAERRLRAEWSLLQALAERNPTRLSRLQADDQTFTLRLSAIPAAPLADPAARPLTEHQFRLVYPRFFPAMPLELYLAEPVFHPNIHPDSGFVCLWDRHSTANTAEHALHKLAAMLGWRLMNLNAIHIMQPTAAALPDAAREQLAATLIAPPLCGVAHETPATSAIPFRRRLS